MRGFRMAQSHSRGKMSGEYTETHQCFALAHRSSSEEDKSPLERGVDGPQFLQDDLLAPLMIKATQTGSDEGKRYGLEALVVGNLHGIAYGIPDGSLGSTREQDDPGDVNDALERQVTWRGQVGFAQPDWTVPP